MIHKPYFLPFLDTRRRVEDLGSSPRSSSEFAGTACFFPFVMAHFFPFRALTSVSVSRSDSSLSAG